MRKGLNKEREGDRDKGFAFPFFFQRKDRMKRKPATHLLVVLCLLAFAAGCAGAGRTAEPVFRDEPTGSPREEARLDPSRIVVSTVNSKEGPFQHPFTLREEKLEGLLQGLYFHRRATFRWKNPERVLGDREAAALAERVVPVFSSLGVGKLVRFRVKGEDGETRGELFVAKDYLNFRILTIQGYNFLKKGTKATSHQWKLAPQEGQGFFPSTAVVWNPKEATNWLVVRTSDLATQAIEGRDGNPQDQPLIDRIDVFP